MWLRFLAFPLALARRPRGGLRAAVGAGHRARLPQPAFARGADRLPAQDPAAHLHRGRRPDRRIRRGAARRGAIARSRRSEERDPRGRGRALLPARRDRLPRRAARRLANLVAGGRRQGASTITMQVARNFFLSSEKTAHPQALRGAARLQDRAQPDQGPDPRALHQPDLPGPARLRLRRGRADLLRQAARPADAGRDRDARRPAEGAVALQPGRQPAARQAAPAVRPAAHARAAATSPQRSTTRRSKRRCGPERRSERIRRARRIRRRDGAPGDRRALSAKRSTRAASASTRPSARPTRKPPTRRCARACWTTTGATATAARKASSSCRPNAGRGRLRRCARRPSGQRRPARRRRARGRRQAGRGGAAHRREDRRSAATGLQFAARALDPTRPRRRSASAAARSSACSASGKNWQIVQLPEVEAAFVSLDPQDGAIRALVGGFDFNRNKFNHVTQAWRQPGSSLQAVHLFGGAREGLHAGDRDQRRAARARRRADRQPALGAEELRRQVRGPDAPAHGARQVEEHGLDPHPARRSGRSTRRTTSRASASTPRSIRPT